MADNEHRLTQEREEIAARVATFRATQRKFERERHDYYDSTLGNAWSGYRAANSNTATLHRGAVRHK